MRNFGLFILLGLGLGTRSLAAAPDPPFVLCIVFNVSDRAYGPRLDQALDAELKGVQGALPSESPWKPKTKVLLKSKVSCPSNHKELQVNLTTPRRIWSPWDFQLLLNDEALGEKGTLPLTTQNISIESAILADLARAITSRIDKYPKQVYGEFVKDWTQTITIDAKCDRLSRPVPPDFTPSSQACGFLPLKFLDYWFLSGSTYQINIQTDTEGRTALAWDGFCDGDGNRMVLRYTPKLGEAFKNATEIKLSEITLQGVQTNPSPSCKQTTGPDASVFAPPPAPQ